MVGEADPRANSGDLVAVYDRADRLIGQGFYHAKSQIAIRLLSYGADQIDDDFFAERIRLAAAWRKKLFTGDDQTNAYRLIHAEGDGLSGLIAERYDDVIVMELFSLGIFQRLDLLKRLLTEITGIEKFVIRADKRIEQLESFHVTPELSDRLPDTLEVRENGVRFRVDLQAGHKTGFFCDQRDNRRQLAALCEGADVLDVCCYTGGFGIYAAANGNAKSVLGVDLDEAAISLARRNAKLNQARIKHVHSDAFGYLRQMQSASKQFDVVVLDPPKFVANRDEMRTGMQKYADLNALGMTLVRPGGVLLTCSCSGLVYRQPFLDMVKAASQRIGRRLQIIDQTGAGPDHPIMADAPESEYLKATWARIL
jgi:23S rRNA (cytosine1962-C5)-methyltransferase